MRRQRVLSSGPELDELDELDPALGCKARAAQGGRAPALPRTHQHAPPVSRIMRPIGQVSGGGAKAAAQRQPTHKPVPARVCADACNGAPPSSLRLHLSRTSTSYTLPTRPVAPTPHRLAHTRYSQPAKSWRQPCRPSARSILGWAQGPTGHRVQGARSILGWAALIILGTGAFGT